MSTDSFKIKNGLNIKPQSAPPAAATIGDIFFCDGNGTAPYDAAGAFQYTGAAWIKFAASGTVPASSVSISALSGHPLTVNTVQGGLEAINDEFHNLMYDSGLSSTSNKKIRFDVSGATDGALLTVIASQAASKTLTVPILSANDTIETLGVNQTITGVKTFSTAPVISSITTNSQTLNLPAITGSDTVATLGLAQTFSAVKTFTLAPVLTSKTMGINSQTLTFPDITGADTVATLGLAQTFSASKTFTLAPILTSGTISNANGGPVTITLPITACTLSGIGLNETITGAKTFNSGKLITDTITTVTNSATITLPTTTSTLDTIGLSARLLNKDLQDTTTTISNVSSTSKALGFSLSGMTSSVILTLASSQSTSQTLTIPNITAGDTIATLGLSQTYSGTPTYSSGLTANSVEVGSSANTITSVNTIRSASSSGLTLKVNSTTTAISLDTLGTLTLGSSSVTGSHILQTANSIPVIINSTGTSASGLTFNVGGILKGQIYSPSTGGLYFISAGGAIGSISNDGTLNLGAATSPATGGSHTFNSTYSNILSLNNTVASGQSRILFSNASGGLGLAGFDNSGNFIVDNSTGSTTYFYVTSSGVFTIGNLSGGGSRTVNASANGTLSAASDSRLKQEDLTAPIPGLSEILKLRPVAYKWLDDIARREENATTEIGFFADETVHIIPSSAPMGNDGYYGFYDRAITATLVKAIQEQNLIISTLQSQMASLLAKYPIS